MINNGIGCGGCGSIGGWIGISLIVGSMLWLRVMNSCFNMSGGWHMGICNLDYI